MAYPSTVAVTAGVGVGIAFDVVGGASFQVVKLDVGATGAAALLGAANPLPSSIIVGGAAVSATNSLPSYNPLLATDLTEVAINAAANGNNTLIAASGGNKIRVYQFFLEVNGSAGVSLKFQDGAGGTDFFPALPFLDKGSWVMGFSGRPWFTGSVNTLFNLNLSAAIQVSGRMYYTVAP